MSEFQKRKKKLLLNIIGQNFCRGKVIKYFASDENFPDEVFPDKVNINSVTDNIKFWKAV